MCITMKLIFSESPLSVTGDGVKDVTVQSSKVATLPCRASVLLGSVSVTVSQWCIFINEKRIKK